MANLRTESLQNFKLKPILLNADAVVASGQMSFSEGGAVSITSPEITAQLAPSQVFDMVLPTIFGLNEALVRAEQGGFLRQRFEDEFASFNSQFEKNGHLRGYGYYAYFPDREHLVQFAPDFWHRLSLVASNAQLYRGPNDTLSWLDVRQIFEKCRPVVAGASVGSKIADAILKVLRPREITIADPAVYKLTNANRTDIQYDDIVYSMGAQNKLNELGEFAPYGMKNKAVSFALKSQRIDPYLTVYPISQGITLGNVAEFVSGGDIVIEEVDMSFDMEIKVAIRAEARRQKKLFVMISDLGSWVQWDIRPFNKNPNIPLFLNCSDEKIYSLNREARQSKELFFSFMEGLIDKHFWNSGEFGETLAGRLPKVVGSMPQLGSTTSAAAGVGAEFIARMLLGYEDIFEQGILDLRKQEMRTYGKMIGDL